MLPILALVLATLISAPLGARGADLLVWWEKGFNPEEDAAIVEVIGAFEQNTGQQVELVLVPQDELPPKVQAIATLGWLDGFAAFLVTSPPSGDHGPFHRRRGGCRGTLASHGP